MEFPESITILFHVVCGEQLYIPSGWCSRCGTTPPTEECQRVRYVREEREQTVMRSPSSGRLYGISINQVGGEERVEVDELQR